MNKTIFITLAIIMLAIVACEQTNDISVTFEGERVKAEVTDERVPLTDLIAGLSLEDPSTYVYTIIGDKESTITYDELSAGELITADNSLSFSAIMCECAGIVDVKEIIITKKTVVAKDGKKCIVTGDLKTYIENYLTSTPEAYTYTINEEQVAYEDLAPAPLIEMALQKGLLELRLAGDDQPTEAYDLPFTEALAAFSSTPDEYEYKRSGNTILLKRNTIRVVTGDDAKRVIISTEDDTQLASLITTPDKEHAQYRLVSEEGFTPPAITWEELKTGVWDADQQTTVFPQLSKKYSIRDLARIELAMKDDAPAAIIMIEDLLGTAERTDYEGEPAVRLSEFLKGVAGAAAYEYQLVAKDGYSPEPFTYEDMEQGYWLLESGITMFPHKNIGKNRIRDLEKIIPLPRA